jgi:hypothetical protein
MRLVLVEWLDSFGCSSEWQSLNGCSPRPLLCRSVGWLFYDGEDCKVIVPHMTDGQTAGVPAQGCGDMTIPTRAILTMTDLALSQSQPA